MSAVQFYYDNFLLDAKIVGQYGQNDLFPASNIVDPRTTKVFRANDRETRGWVYFDMGKEKTPNSFLVKLNPFSTRIPYGGFSAYYSNSFNPTSITMSGVSGFRGSGLNLHSTVFGQFDIAIRTQTSSNLSYRYWALQAIDTSANRVIEIPTCFLGVKTLGLENIGIDYGWSMATNSLDKITRNRYGQKFIDKVIQQRVLSLGIRLITKDELDVFMDMFEKAGTHRPVWIVIDPDEVIINDKERFMIYGYFASIPKITNNVFAHYDLDLVIEEAI